MQVSITQDRNEQKKTTTYHIEFEDRELVEMGRPPTEMSMTAHQQTMLFDPKVNPSALDTAAFKLLQLSWMAQRAHTPKGHGYPFVMPGDSDGSVEKQRGQNLEG